MLRCCVVGNITEVSPLSTLEINIRLFLIRLLRACFSSWVMLGLWKSTDMTSKSNFIAARLHLSNLLALVGMLCVYLLVFFVLNS